MRQSLFLLTLIISLTGCKTITKEIKKAVKIQNAAEEVCDCDKARVSSSYNNGYSSSTITLEGVEADDKQALADKVFANVKKVYPAICKKDEVIINVKKGGVTRGFVYENCGEVASETDLEYNEEQIEEEVESEIEELEEEIQQAEEEFEARIEELEDKLDNLLDND
ncbi:MAG: hypothetical protein ACPGVI_04610 [Crocinitomicaceae bacterium]